MCCNGLVNSLLLVRAAAVSAAVVYIVYPPPLSKCSPPFVVARSRGARWMPSRHPITRWRVRRGRARSTSPVAACRCSPGYHRRRPWEGRRRAARVSLRKGTGEVGVSLGDPSARREIRRRERDGSATDRRRGGYPRAIRRRRCLGAVRRPSQSRPSRSSRLSPVWSGEETSSKTRLRLAANRRQRRDNCYYEVNPEPPSRATRHSVAREPHRSSRPDVCRAFNPRVSSISAPAHRTHQVRR